MKTMMKKLTCWLLTLAMCLMLAPVVTPEAKAATGDLCTLTFSIDGTDLGAGTIACSKPKGPYHVGDSITVRATAGSGYTFVSWVNYATQEVIDKNEFTFVLQGDTEWTVIFKKDGEYFIYVNKPYDSLKTDPEKSSYAPGTTVTLNVPAESGRSVVYEVANAEEGKTVDELNWQRLDGSTFTMPNNDVWVRALYSINLTVECSTGGTATLSPEGPYYEGDTVRLTLNPEEGYYAQSVSGTTQGTVNGNTLTFKLSNSRDRTINVKFAERSITPINFFAAPEDGGTVTVSVDNENQTVTATAKPSNGYHFYGWMDLDRREIISTNATETFQPTGAMRILAVFYLRAVIDSKIQHGTLEIVNSKMIYSSGDTVTLLAHPDPGYIVDGYYAGEVHNGSATLQPLEGNSFVMPAWDMVASVQFVRGYHVNAAASSEEGGTVFGAGTYRDGEYVVLTALPSDGYTFMGWQENGTIVSTAAEYSFYAEADRNLTAVFQEYTGMTFTIGASALPAEGGTITGAGSYEGGETVTLAATANPGYTFLNWSENGTVVSEDAEYSFTANANRTLAANFQSDTGVSYVDAKGDPQLCETFTTITSGMTALSAGWYAVAGNVTIADRVNVSGNVNLILCDGAVLTVPKGIHLTGSDALTIWVQSGGTGALVIERTENNNAGIGGNEKQPGGVFTMNGGKITVTGGENAAGIGGGGDGNATKESLAANTGMNTRGWAGTITINGGTVTATGGDRGAGIGCGQRGNGGSITITGGTVVANGGFDSAGIGGAESSVANHQSIESIHITGGDVTAVGGEQAAAIGGGLWCRIGNVTIDGGTVHATGGKNGAGIGTGYFGADGQITINDGDVTATGGNNGAGIGGGRCLYGTVTINGGTVHATGGGGNDNEGGGGAGIGGGQNLGTAAYRTGKVTITGGDVTAIGGTSKFDSGAGIGGGAYGPGGNVTISGGTVRASGGSHAFCNGAGIGGGYNAAGGTVQITDGTVIATGGPCGAGIGSGSNYSRDDALSAGTVTISGGSVTANGGKYAAGIGGGYGVPGGTVTISGGDNTVTGGSMYSGSPSYGGGGAGIGGGYNAAGGSFTFTGGTTRVKAGDWDDEDHMPQAVGHGDHVVNCDGTVSFGDSNTHVRVGYVQSWGVRWANASERASYARNYGYQVIFQSCEPHSYDRNGKCGLCGAADGPVLQDIPYVNAAGQAQSDAACQSLTAEGTTWDTSGACRGWYAATGNVTIDSRVTVSGNVNLILCDGATLTVPKGIEVPEGNSLTIWRQSGAKGALYAGTTNGTDASCAAGDAGIGGGSGKNGGNITVYGGNITAAAGDGAQALGHGSGAAGAGSLTLLCMRVFDSAAATTPVGAENRDGVCRGSFVKLVSCTEHHMVNGVCELCDLHESVSYLDPSDGKQHTCAAYIPYTGQSALTDGWYVLADDVTTSGRIAVTGDVNLILPDGKAWNAAGGVVIGVGGSLTVWAQGDGANVGALTAAGASGQAGIESTGSALTVNGGAVTATGGSGGAGVGGNSGGSGGTVTINSGTLTASGGANAQAIGRGSGDAASGELNINGFKVGYVDGSGAVTQWAAGRSKMDACRNTSGAKIRLERCTSHEDSDSDGFCDYCGAAYYYDPSKADFQICEDYTLYSGQEELNSGWYVVDLSRQLSGRISIKGNVNLILMDGAELSAAKGIRVAEGNSLTIFAHSTGSAAGRLIATGNSGNAGIGGNSGENGGSVTFCGGTITLSGGNGAQAIGCGSGSSNSGSLSLDVMRVGTVGDGNSVSWVGASDRASTCRSTTGTIRLMFCAEHSYTVFKDNGNGTHTPCCEFCAHNGAAQAHSFNEEHLCVCGAADGIPYIDPTDEDHPVKVCHDAYTTVTEKTKKLTTGWYVFSGNINNNHDITVEGDVNIILCDGARLDMGNHNIKVFDGNSLTIWGQSSSTGCLTINNNGTGSFTCIGGTGSAEAGSITINGGNINISNLKGGTSIGGGGSNASVTINGGTVSLTSAGAGIGGVTGRDGGNITITGGTITINTTGAGAGIGGGSNNLQRDAGSGGNITISGGNITVNATGTGVGIGGGSAFSNHNGSDFAGGNGGNITISGGTVTVNTAGPGAGIGGGNSCNRKKCGGGGTVTITGGTVVVNSKGKWAIGPGVYTSDIRQCGEAGSLMIGAGMTVTAGANEAGAHMVSDDERVNACQSNAWVKIEPASQTPAATYAVAVNSGTGSGSYAEGASVTITADAPAQGKRFKEWTGTNGLTFTSGSATSSTATFTMPASAVTLTATYEDTPTTYTVTVTNDGHGTGSAFPASGVSGTEVTLTATPASGYHFKEWQVVSGGVSVTGSKFTIGTANVEVKAIFEADTPTPDPTPTPTPTPTPDPDPTPSGRDTDTTPSTPSTPSTPVAEQRTSETATAADGAAVTTELDTSTTTTTNRDGSVTVTDKATETVKTENTDGSSVETKTETVNAETTDSKKNADGSVTDTTKINNTETVTEIKTDGSGGKTVTETKTEQEHSNAVTTKENADGSVSETTETTETVKVTETVTDASGKVTESVTETTTETKTDLTTAQDGTAVGTSTTTTTVKDDKGNVLSTAVTEAEITAKTDENGVVTTETTATTTTTDAQGNETVEKTVTTENKTPDGSTGTVVKDEDGNILSQSTTISQQEAEAARDEGRPVQSPLAVTPVPEDQADTAKPVQINMPPVLYDKDGDGAVSVAEMPKVEISVTYTRPGVIGMMQDLLGKWLPIKECYEGSVIVPVTGTGEIIIVDNAKTFADVSENSWYNEYVTFVTAREIFNGTGGGRFDPNAPMTRAMLVQMLYNFTRGAKAGDGTAFSDVSAGSWFSDAVGWALKNGIVNAAELFRPQDSISRQEMATMLYRYAKWAGYDVSKTASLDRFSDAGDVAAYAAEAMRWAVGMGLIDGTQNGTRTVVLDPRGSATRAQVAAIMTRFVRNVK